ncbi:beta-ketoacyl-ACP synthase III [Pseudoclavibacter soli]|uniref:beta-ketoacyl-ACP synthase III n=1 Tax=Pseudoclavibacter soli TaxID=452623 RepID=UPI00041A85AE|nr:beta-ketoacyl-ACP synthase III [Pseudoclavibacter soli]
MSTTLRTATGPQYSRILGIGAQRGDVVVTNDELVGPIDSSDEWIQQRTGIIDRRRASAEVGVKDLALGAARQAIEQAGIEPSQIGAVIVATVTHPYQTPSLAAWLTEQIGATPAAAYDISAACAGYCYGIGQADALVRSGLADYVLVIGAEKLSDIVDPTDRSISFLLGDGAGAAVVGPSETPAISPTQWGSDGSHWDTIYMTNSLNEFREGDVPWPTLRQVGRTVFRWAVWDMAKVARRTIDAAGLTPDDIDVFVPHQANMRIIDEFAKQLHLPESVVIARDIAHSGNTSAASIPIATRALLDSGQAKSGDVALEIGFGAGLVYGAQIVVLP